MPVNKVIYGQNTLIDLTGDTVTADTLSEGVVAHGADGSRIQGTGVMISGEPDKIMLTFGLEDSSDDTVLDSSNRPVKCNRLYLPL